MVRGVGDWVMMVVVVVRLIELGAKNLTQKNFTCGGTGTESWGMISFKG